MNPVISIVSPVYRGENLVEELTRRISSAVEGFTEYFEIILVEDGSPDKSWNSIQKVMANYPNVTGVKLSRNFGQHAAIQAGIEISTGDWVVVLDCDLQDKPEEIPRLFEKAQSGFDVVFAKRKVRKDHFLKRLSSKAFYKTLAYLTETEQNPEIANFGIYNRKVIDAVTSMNDYLRYFPSMIKWVGFTTSSIEVTHSNRFEGETSYSWKKLIRLALSVILTFSDKPLRLTVRFGLLISIAAFLVALVTFIFALLGKYDVTGWASLMISIWFLTGIVITILGVIGLYLGRVFEQVKRRPVYIIDKIVKS